ncbi:hypothetical protein INT45_013387 [Circinella minor]|uniref:NDT80 domain-containing protein n=1 Tax=Circinella minor TaxID=1195481 RepID=A0A8H7VPQ4_9FUNG|nr:hypothetical protein INT45_013387 [Circinella minor]
MSIQNKKWSTLHSEGPSPIHPPVNRHASTSVTNPSAAVGASMSQQPILPPPTITNSTNHQPYHPTTTISITNSSQQAYMPPNSSPSVKQQQIPGYNPSNSARSHTGFTAMSQPTTPRPTSEIPTTYNTPPEDNNTASPKQQLVAQPPPTPTSASSEHHPHSQYPVAQDDQHHHNTQQPQAEHPSSSVYSSDANALVRRRRKESVYFQDDSPAFTATRYKRNIYAMDRNTVLEVHIQARIDRGFFLADNDWTCYRRNYFQLSGAFNLQGIGVIYDGQELPCLVQHEGQLYPISNFLIGVTARIANSEKVIPLIQHTPKRDKGPQSTPDPKPIRPGGNIAMSTVGATQSVVTFERVQFKSATANNGKRRAAQQYYLVVVDLYAQIPSGESVLVGTVESSPLVVRGRSPGHYAEADATHQQQQQQRQDQQAMNYTRFVGFPQHGGANGSANGSGSGEYNNSNYEYQQNAAAAAAAAGAGYSSHSNGLMPPPPPPPHGGMVPPPYHHPPHTPYALHERTASANSSSSEMYEYENGQSRYPVPPPPHMEHWNQQRMRIASNSSSTSSVDHSQSQPQQQHNYEHYSHPPYYDGRPGIPVNPHPSLPPPMSSSSTYHQPSYSSMQSQTWRPAPIQQEGVHYQYNNNNNISQPESKQTSTHESDERSVDQKIHVEEHRKENRTDQQDHQEENTKEDEKDVSNTINNNKRSQDDFSSSSQRATKSRRTARSSIKRK